LRRHSSTMGHLSSTPASSSLCPHSRSGQCRSIRNPASHTQPHRTGSQEEMVRCHLLGRSTTAHPGLLRTSSSSPWRYTQLRRSPKSRSLFDQTLQHHIEDQGSVRAQVSVQVRESVAPAGRYPARSSHQHSAAIAVQSADSPNGNRSEYGCSRSLLEASHDLARDRRSHDIVQRFLLGMNRRQVTCEARSGTTKMLAGNPTLIGSLDAPGNSGLERRCTTGCPFGSSPPTQHGPVHLACNPD